MVQSKRPIHDDGDSSDFDRSGVPDISIVWPDHKSEFSSFGSKAMRDHVARQAPWWNYALLNRERWRGTDFLNVAQQTRALELWERLFGRPGMQRPLESSLPPVMEVVVRPLPNEDGQNYQTMPWEFVINAVIRSHIPWENRESHRVPVIRRLETPSSARHHPDLPPDPNTWRILVVLSSPGFIGKIYSLNSEREMLYKVFRHSRSGKSEVAQDDVMLDTGNFQTLWSPSFFEVQKMIRSFKPHIVHFAGCDTHQAFAITEASDYNDKERELMLGQLETFDDDPNHLTDDSEDEHDGYVLLHERSTVVNGREARLDCVSYRRLPELFDEHKPALVCWNLYHSGNKTAAMAVATGGVGASVGFQDFVDDEIAEEYFKEFYAGLKHSRGRIGLAHVRGLNALWRLPDSLRGAGIVCWTHSSRLNEFLSSDSHEKTQPTALKLHVGPKIDRDKIKFEIKVPEGLNYAQLHQRQYPFLKFRVAVEEPLEIKDLTIEVKLNGEDRELAFREQFDLQAPFADMRERIVFPLTAPLARSCGESVVTTLYVKLQYRDQLLLSNTYPTRLLPADQWRFSEGSAHTLASFVFPRDAEIERLVLNAQKYVRVLRDDATAGFEGYQAGSADAIDLQVRALWSTLLHEYRIGYINPPPAYSREADSQRLRTPTMVLKGGWGTCIDLALLLAAAFELVDIHPVIFVLKTHAFVGYWRSSEARDRFLQVDGSLDGDERIWKFVPRRPVNGMFLSSSLDEIRKYIDTGDMVALEATLLTTAGGFEDAIGSGLDNLGDANEFDYMIDLMSARAAQITPLPLNQLGGLKL